MPDARVIPIGGDDRPRRSVGGATRSAAGCVAGLRRAVPAPSGHPAARRGSRGGRAQPAGAVAAPSYAEGQGQHADRTDRTGDRGAARRGARAGAGPRPTSCRSGSARWPAALAFVRRRLTGDVEVDEFGFDPELTDQVLLAALRPLYDHYFRVEARGLENIPSEGGALVVANHSGTIPLDSVMTQIALLDHHPARRHLRMLGADLVFQTPIVSELARKSGTTLACNADAERLLARGELVGVWPEGFKGIGKPFSERYKLQRFGRGGFVSAALRGAGADRAVLDRRGRGDLPDPRQRQDAGPAARAAVPAGHADLPVARARWARSRCRASGSSSSASRSRTDGFGVGAADDPMLVFNLTDQVRETIQHTLYRLLMSRRSIFF